MCYDIEDIKTAEELNCNNLEILTWDKESEKKFKKKNNKVYSCMEMVVRI